MARNFFDNLPSTRTPVEAGRMNGLLDGDEAMGNIVVDSIRGKNLFNINGQVNVKANDGAIGSFNTVNGDTLTTNANNQNQYEYGQQLKNLNGKTITFSAKCVSNGTGNGGIIAIYDNYVYKLGKTITNGNTDSITYTCTSNNIIVGFCTSYGRDAQFTNIQVEINDTATTYAPYQGLGYVSGHNSNGNYVKYDDGRLEQWGIKVVGSVAITSSRGSMYSSSSQTAITFPIEFISAPEYLNLQSQYGDNFYWLVQINNSTKANTGSYYLISPTSYTDANVRIGFHAIGRWK